MGSMEMISALNFDKIQLNTEMGKETHQGVPSGEDETLTLELEKEILRLQTAVQQASNHEESRAADKMQIILQSETIQNLRKELAKTKSESSEVQYNINMICSKCQQSENGINHSEEEKESSDIKKSNNTDTDEDEQKAESDDQVCEQKKKYIVVNYNFNFHSLYAADSVEFVDFDNSNNLKSLRHQASSYHKEMFIVANYWFLNPSSGYPSEYADLLSICRHWKQMRPEGEIHALGWFEKYQATCDLPAEMRSLLTSYNTLNRTTDKYKEFPKAISKYWSKYSDQLLKKELK